MGGGVSFSCKNQNSSYAMDQYGSFSGEGIFLVASCLRNHDKPCPDGSPDVYANSDLVCMRVRSHCYTEKNLHGSAFRSHIICATVQVFEGQTLPQSVTESASVPCKRPVAAQVKKFVCSRINAPHDYLRISFVQKQRLNICVKVISTLKINSFFFFVTLF